MCYFPISNPDRNSISYKKGVTEFDCGSCPECLRKRANVWALRAVYEAREHAFNCMVTLTYDSYIYDSRGNIIGERVSDFSVCKRDLQLFMKRLRKWYSSVTDEKIKYLACAEYGKRTHRAHYHALLFGVQFPDLVYYKRSKRGNVIYKSHILDTLWKNGICTVDSINVGSAVARYCTKYCAKERSDDTFMLFSQDIGMTGLLRDFNGFSYFIEGREFPIPRAVWEKVISSRYPCSNRYVNRTVDSILDGSFELSKQNREVYRWYRDQCSDYCDYLQYWHDKAQSFEKTSVSVHQRILNLDDTKYHNYKVAALRSLSLRREGIPYPAPRSGCVSEYSHYFLSRFGFEIFCEVPHEVKCVEKDLPLTDTKYFRVDTCAIASRPNSASDTKDILSLPGGSLFIGPLPRSRSLFRERKLRSDGWKIFLHKTIDFDPFK